MSIALSTTLRTSFGDAVERTRKALAAQGFGVLTEIDMQATLKAKLGEDMEPYLILGACNPPLAHQALQAELEIGLMLPCNVIVYEADSGKTIVSAIDPTQTMASVGNPKLKELAEAVREKLARALSRLA